MIVETLGNMECTDLVSIVIPAHNEAKHIGGAMWAIYQSFADTGIPLEIIVIDDGSTDSTRISAQRAAQSLPIAVRIHSLPNNRGKGYAIREGFLASRGGLVGFVDADLEYPVNALPLMAQLLHQSPQSCAIATRVADNRKLAERITSQVAHKVAATILQLPIRDTQAGMKMFPGDFAREVLGHCHQDGWLYDIEALLRAIEQKLAIVEVPVSQHSVRPRRASIGTMVSCVPTFLKLSVQHWRNLRKQSTMELGQVMRFALVGAANTITDLAAFWTLVHFWSPLHSGIDAAFESLLAWILASLVGYMLHSRYTFRQHLSRVGFYVVTGVGVSLQMLFAGGAAQWMGAGAAMYGKILGIVIASVFTYWGYRYLARRSGQWPRHTLISRVNIAPVAHTHRPNYAAPQG